MSAKFGAWLGYVGAALALLVTLAGGCGGDDPPKAAAGTGPCTVGTKECVHETLARVCSPESTWLAKSCHANEKCVDGDCKVDAVTADCEPNTGSCTDATNGFRCKPDLKGFEVITCPGGTTCREGLCIGACTVGQSKCLGNGYLATCLDGRTFTETGCNTGEYCVTTSGTGSPFTTAACKPAECAPPNSCSRTCGDKINATADQTKALSDCIATPDGYRWQVTHCAAHESCNPTGQGCGVSGQATCSSDCTPGVMRCSPDKLGTQVCGPDGKWAAAVTPCNPDPANGSLVCMTSDTNTAKVVCADAFCAAGQTTTCAGDQVRICADGKLGAPIACTNGGVCLPTSASAVAGVTPGSCNLIQCQPTEERCVLGSYQTCVNNKWSNPIACPAGADGGPNACVTYATPAGLSQKICNAECVPGNRRCRAADGDAGNSGLQVCDANGIWGAVQACAVGTCKTNVISGASAACVADCLPTQPVCTGLPKPIIGTNAVGTDSFAMCNSNGTLPAASTACGGQTACRRDPSGQVIAPGGNACIECVGANVASGNERGQVDRRCLGGDGGAGTASSQACSTGNTWEGAVACTGGNLCSSGFCSARATFSGVATNVPQSSMVGWTECFSGGYSSSASFSSILSQCSGANLMLACRLQGSDNLITAAYAPRGDVLFDTGINTTTVHVANGVGWYFNQSWSWGYAPEGEVVNKSTCDFESASAANQRTCWQASGSFLSSGYRCGAQTTFSAAYERVILQAD